MDCELSSLILKEKIWLTICSASGEQKYIITTPSEQDRREYRIYRLRGSGDAKLLGTGPNPRMLENRYVAAKSLE